MPKPKFDTVVDDLLPVAEGAHAHLVDRGYKVRTEVMDYASPFTPTMSAVRGSTTLHLDVTGSMDLNRLREWVAYGKSSGRDTRLVVCTPDTLQISAGLRNSIREIGVGLFTVGAGGLQEEIAPADLAMPLQLPKLSTLPARARELLGPSYDKCDRGEWREGFEEACSALEEEAKRYLKYWSKKRIKVQTKKGAVQLTARQIDGMTIGALRRAFASIVTPTVLDVRIEEALGEINPERIARVHNRRAKRTETRLRANAGRHLWLIVKVLKEMCA